MKRDRSELEFVKSKVDFTYSHFGNSLIVDTKKLYREDQSSLGYCYKSKTDRIVNYTIVCHSLEIPETDFRIMMHEYGHIYLGHLEGLHEEIDSRILWVLQNEREELIEHINKECGIDYAEKLLNRVMDDPSLNHSLHNIAMDMEVNTSVLSTEDIEEMEKDISGALPDVRVMTLKKKLTDPGLGADEKKEIEDVIKQLEAEIKIKLILPCRYHFKDGSPFPDEKTYIEYILMIIRNLDQFVKMLISIKKGGNGDTSGVTAQDVQDALGQDGQGLGDLMASAGMTPGSSMQPPKDGDQIDCPYNSQGQSNDHGTPERDKADSDRAGGNVRAHSGTPGRSDSGDSGGGTRQVNVNVDPIDMAIDEVMCNFKSRVTKREIVRQVMRKYNRGINRQVISPSYRMKTTKSTRPTIVFLIDVSGSMDTHLIDRILKSISMKMKNIQKGLKYNIITCSTRVEHHYENIDPRKPIPRIHSGGGTRLATGFDFFRDHYDKNAILILISDFEDNLYEWHQKEAAMTGYTMYGFNYGWYNYNQEWTNFKVKNFTNKNGYQ